MCQHVNSSEPRILKQMVLLMIIIIFVFQEIKKLCSIIKNVTRIRLARNKRFFTKTINYFPIKENYYFITFVARNECSLILF